MKLRNEYEAACKVRRLTARTIRDDGWVAGVERTREPPGKLDGNRPKRGMPSIARALALGASLHCNIVKACFFGKNFWSAGFLARDAQRELCLRAPGPSISAVGKA